MQKENSFFYTICQMRTKEEVILVDNLIQISEEEIMKVAFFLEEEYKREVNNHPNCFTNFDKKAAIWAAKVTYFAWQLLINRKNTFKEIEKYLQKYDSEINESAIISADLCLRFLPQVVLDLKRIDVQDPIIILLEEILEEFKYSAIGYGITSKGFKEQELIEDSLNLKLLFLNRIVERKDYTLASIPFWENQLKIYFGDYKKIFWKEL